MVNNKVKNKINIMIDSLPDNYFPPDFPYNEKRKMVQKSMFPQNDPNYVPPAPLTNIERRREYWEKYGKARNAGEFNTNNNNNNNKNNKKIKNNNKNKTRKQLIKNKYGPKFNFRKTNKKVNNRKNGPNNIFPSSASSVSNIDNTWTNSNNSSNYDPENIERYTGIVENFNLPLTTSKAVYKPRPL
jgi:hypothetical protein